MSDFDAALERLMSDPVFAAALAADPDAALIGYRLDADEAALLRSQFTADPGGESRVETRTNQSSTFGLLAPLLAVFDLPATGGIDAERGHGVSSAGGPATAGCGPAPAAVAGLGAAGGAGGGLGAADVPARTGLGAADVPARTGLGAADVPATSGLGVPDVPARSGIGAPDEPAAATGFGAAGSGAAGSGGAGGPGFGSGGALSMAADDGVPPPADYRNRVDADGDGTWDRHRFRGRADGGVDILVDLNGDGRADFIGHDDDADGRVESAHYDTNHDGWFEKQMFDDNGDGWQDRSVRRPPPGA